MYLIYKVNIYFDLKISRNLPQFHFDILTLNDSPIELEPICLREYVLICTTCLRIFKNLRI